MCLWNTNDPDNGNSKDKYLDTSRKILPQEMLMCNLWPFIWTNLNPHHIRMLCAISLVEIGPLILKKKFVNVFSLFPYYFPLEKGVTLHLKKTWIPITQGCFVPSLVKIGPDVFKKIFNVHQCIFAISLLSPLGKGRGSSFEQTWIPITKGCFVPCLVEIGQVVLQKKMNMWKVYR